MWENPLSALPCPFGSCFAEQQIDHPTTSYMLARPATVREDVGIGTAGVFEGIGKKR